MHETLHILIIEDDLDTRLNLCDILSMDNYVVSAAGSAEEAFALDLWPQVSVVILDRRLPDGSADSLLPQIRQRAPQAAVIIVTGYADLQSTISALRLGAYDYILKPINADALRSRLVRLGELREAQRRALQAERLAAIGEMITGLAHESRNALQRTQACVEMLRLEVADVPTALNLCDRIQNAQDDLSRLYEEVRGYAAPIQLERHDYDLRQIWRLAWRDVLSARTEASPSFVEEVAADTQCYVDPFSLGQVFRNVFENAIAVTPQDGCITLRCHPAALRGQAGLSVTVTDEGPGIPAQLRERVFEPFFTTKTKGTGLGMAIAKRIVEAHQGEIRVGTPANGAEIQLHLPVRPQ